MKFFFYLYAFLCAHSVLVHSAFACPSIDGIPDYDCDGQVQISVIGDSYVAGRGDIKNGNVGGYVLRLANALPDVTVDNFGTPGQTSEELLDELRWTWQFDQYSNLRLGLEKSDIIIIDIGRNDFATGVTPEFSKETIKRIAGFLKTQIKLSRGDSPFIATSVLMIPNRNSTAFVKQLDALLLKDEPKRLPALRFDKISRKFLSSDNLHPRSSGYDQIATTLLDYLLKTVPSLMKRLRPDSDFDGIPNIFESRYGTDPLIPDSDNDGKLDGYEVFESKTDPLTPN